MADEIDDGFDDDSGAVAAFDAVFNPPADGAQPAAPQAATPDQPAQPVAAASASAAAPETPAQPGQATPQDQSGQPAQAAAPSQPQAQAPAAAAPSAATSELDRTLTFAKVLTTQLQQQLMGEFSDIASEADVYKLMENPERYNRFAIAVAKVQAANSQVGQLEQQRIKAGEEANKAAEGERIKARAETSKKIGELIPDLLKPDVAPKLSADMTAYARANEVPPGRYVDATAGEVNILYKAMQYDASKASEAAAIKTASEKASKAPPVQQPGTRVPGDARTEKMQESFTNLQKFGRDEDATAIFANLLG